MKQLSKSASEVVSLEGVDEDNGEICFTANEGNGRQPYLYKMNMDGTGPRQLSVSEGFHNPMLSANYKYFLDQYSPLNDLSSLSLFNTNGKNLPDSSLIRSRITRDRLSEYNVQRVEQFIVNAANGNNLNGWVITPYQNDANKPLPLLLYVYGGHMHQEVKNQWMDKLGFNNAISR